MVSVLSKVSVLSRLSKKLPDTNCIDIKTKADKEEGDIKHITLFCYFVPEDI